MLVLSNLMTESDNRTHDLFRYLSLISILVSLGLQIYSVMYINQPFNMVEFGTGIGALFGGIGVVMGLKKESIEKQNDT